MSLHPLRKPVQLSLCAQDVHARRTLFDRAIFAYTQHRFAIKEKTRQDDLRHIKKFSEHAGKDIGNWRASMFDSFIAEAFERGVRKSSMRGVSRAITLFTKFTRSEEYDICEEVVRLYGHPPRVLGTGANRLLHVEAEETGSNVRALHRWELRALFAAITAAVSRDGVSSLDAQLAYRDYMLLAFKYAFLFRNYEAGMTRLQDLMAVPYAPHYGEYGAARTIVGKAKAFGPFRARTVFTMPTVDWIVPELKQYVEDVLPRYRRVASDYIFLTQHGTPMQSAHVGSVFRKWREIAGLDPCLTSHSLRRSGITHALEDGYSMHTVSKQAGHDHESSTSIYDYREESTVTTDITRMQQHMLGEDE